MLSWYSSMANSGDETHGNLYAEYVLARIEYYKCSGHPEYEFLLFHFRMADRLQCLQTVPCRYKAVPSNNHLNKSLPHHPTPDSAPQLQVRYTSFSKLCTFGFPSSSARSALQVSTVLSLVHRRPRRIICTKTNAMVFLAQHGAP